MMFRELFTIPLFWLIIAGILAASGLITGTWNGLTLAAVLCVVLAAALKVMEVDRRARDRANR